MNFLLSDEQLEIQRSIERFLEGECSSQQLHRMFDGDQAYAPDVWRGLCDLGIPAIMVSESDGGLGLKLIDLAIVAESLGYSATPAPFLGHVLATLAIILSGSEEQRQRWLPSLASGDLLATIAVAEAGEQWAPDQWQLAPANNALTGTKGYVPNAGEANLLVVGLTGGQFAVVESGASGLQVENIANADRTRRLNTVKFEATPCELMPGSLAESNHWQDAALTLLAADAFGGARRCLDLALDYAKIREQFGRPIGAFQGLKHQLVNIGIDIEPARGLYWFAAHAWDDIPEDAASSAALAKAHLTDRYLQAARDAIEAHGGIGYTWEHDAQIYLKRAMFDFGWMGSPAMHRARVADLSGW